MRALMKQASIDKKDPNYCEEISAHSMNLKPKSPTMELPRSPEPQTPEEDSPQQIPEQLHAHSDAMVSTGVIMPANLTK